MAWEKLGGVAPSDLVDTRLQLHWAAQLPASIGFTFATPRPDWSHTSLQWNRRRRLLLGAPVGSDAVRTGISLAALELLLIDRDGSTESFPLAGKTLEDGYHWLSERSARLHSRSAALVRPDHEMPDHPVGSGATFDAPEAERRELSNWFNSAAHVLEKVSRDHNNASPVRCWPHHFDIATLILLDTEGDSERARSIAAGMSPGDQSIGEPYFYVTPWPYPNSNLLPDLPVGCWNTTGWVGAALTGTALAALAARPAGQFEAALTFFDFATAASRRLLEPP